MIAKAREVELIHSAQKGDGEAIAELIAAHQDALYAFMLRISGRPHIAEDIVQEAFVRVLRNLDRFDTRFRFSTWVFTIAKRLYVNAMQKHRPVFDTDTVAVQRGKDAGPSVISIEFESSEHLRGILDDAILGLNEQQREIVVLFHQLNWPIADIADELGMPEGTVKSHLHRARARMRRQIQDDQQAHARVQEILT